MIFLVRRFVVKIVRYRQSRINGSMKIAARQKDLLTERNTYAHKTVLRRIFLNYVKYRSMYNKTKRKAKQQFNRNEEGGGESRAFWKNLKRYSGSNKTYSENLLSNDRLQHFSEVLRGERNHNDRNLDLNLKPV